MRIDPDDDRVLECLVKPEETLHVNRETSNLTRSFLSSSSRRAGEMTVSKASRKAGEVTRDFDWLKCRRIPFRWVILKVPRSGGSLPCGATVCIETQTHSRLNLPRDFHAMPLSICVRFSFFPVGGHERAL
jgi:hypothetical protein